jgi:hypothetical protein
MPLPRPAARNGGRAGYFNPGIENLEEEKTMVTVDRLTPAKGGVGNTLVIHGSGFAPNTVAVKFGSRACDDIQVTPSGRQVTVNIPVKYAFDPNPVLVEVYVNGVKVDPSVGPPLKFEYNPAGELPRIDDFQFSSNAIIIPSSPKVIYANMQFDVTFKGDNFVTGPRTVSAVWAVGESNGTLFKNSAVVGSPQKAAFTVTFGTDPQGSGQLGLPLDSHYFVIEFSDGAPGQTAAFAAN